MRENKDVQAKGARLIAKKNYNSLIAIISVIVPSLVTLLFFAKKIEGYDFSFLPPFYASINGITAILLIIALWAIRNKKVALHKNLMTACIALSVIFLLSYVVYHSTSDSTKFGGEGAIRSIYFLILISHILLSIAIVPLVLITYVRALSAKFDKHRKIARITWPVWLYVTISGVVVYLMISPYYPH